MIGSFRRHRRSVFAAVAGAAMVAGLGVVGPVAAAAVPNAAPTTELVAAPAAPVAVAEPTLDVAADDKAAEPVAAASITAPEAPPVDIPWERTESGPCDTDIDYGEVISCNMPGTGTIRDLEFPASTGDRIRVRVVVTGGSVNPITSIRLGAGVICAPTFADEFTCLITANGTHTLRIDANGTGPGSIATTIQRLNDPVGCKDLPVGITGKTGAIGNQVEIDCWSRDGSTGQRWRIRLVETGGTVSLNHEVIRPDGTTVCTLNGSTETTCLLDATGQFRILAEDDNGLDEGSYRIVLEKFPNPVGCAAANFGAARTLKSDDAGEFACVTFPGSINDRIRIRVVVSSGTWNPLTDVMSADGSTVCAVTFSDEFTCTLTSNGSHAVFVRDGAGTGQSTGEARFFLQRLNDPAGCTTLKPGITGKSASIGTAVEIDCFAQAATSGQRWRIRIVETSGTASINHEVIRPDGSTVCTLNGSTETTCLLDATGEFRILAEDDNGLDEGTYRIVLEKFPNPAGCEAADVGGSTTMEVTAAGAIACAKFAGSAGDRIRIRFVVTSGTWNPLTDVMSADGTTVCAVTFSDEYDCALTTGGSHTIIFRDGAGTGSSTGAGAFYIQKLNKPVGCSSIAYGPVGKTGTINKPVELDCFRHDGTAGQRWRIRVVETAGTASLNHDVVRPDGSVVCTLNGSTETTCLLDANGEFRVLVQDDNGLEGGDYRIVVERFPNPTGCAELAFADASDVEVSAAGAIACVEVEGQSGDRLRVRAVVTGGAWNPLTEVLAKDGQTVCSVTFSDQFDCALTTTGTHTIVVRDGAGTGASTGTADLFVQRLNQPASCPTLDYGPDGSTASINNAVEIDCFKHSANAGQRWRIRVVETGGTASLNHDVVRPDGSVVCTLNGSTDTACLLDVNGEFRIMVEDDNGLETGDYRIVLERFPGPTGCGALVVGGATESGSVSLAGAIACFTFSGQAGDEIAFSSTSSGAWNPLTEVLRADGSTLCGPTFADAFNCTLTTNGSHTVIIRDGAGTGSSTGSYALAADEV